MTTLRAPVDSASIHSPEPDQPAAIVPPAASYLLLALGICTLWAGAIWTAGHLEPDPVLRQVALFAHLAFLIVGFGAVLTLDWFAALWLFGRTTLPALLHMAAGAHLMIWTGLVGLATSGVFLSPELHQLTWVKLGGVLLVALNGLNAYHLQGRLETAHLPVSHQLLTRAALTGGISQAGWWIACCIGFVNAG